MSITQIDSKDKSKKFAEDVLGLIRRTDESINNLKDIKYGFFDGDASDWTRDSIKSESAKALENEYLVKERLDPIINNNLLATTEITKIDWNKTENDIREKLMDGWVQSLNEENANKVIKQILPPDRRSEIDALLKTYTTLSFQERLDGFKEFKKIYEEYAKWAQKNKTIKYDYRVILRYLEGLISTLEDTVKKNKVSEITPPVNPVNDNDDVLSQISSEDKAHGTNPTEGNKNLEEKPNVENLKKNTIENKYTPKAAENLTNQNLKEVNPIEKKNTPKTNASRQDDIDHLNGQILALRLEASSNQANIRKIEDEMSKIKKEKESLKTENEQLKLKIKSLEEGFFSKLWEKIKSFFQTSWKKIKSFYGVEDSNKKNDKVKDKSQENQIKKKDLIDQSCVISLDEVKNALPRKKNLSNEMSLEKDLFNTISKNTNSELIQ